MHDTPAAAIRSAAVKFSERDTAVFTGEPECPPLGLVRGNLFRVVDTTVCRCGHQFVDVGLRHSAKFITCPLCEGILSIDDVFWVMSSGFRPASVEEEKDYNEVILYRSLNHNSNTAR